MHPAATIYIRDSLQRFSIEPESILEFGSYNVNGTVRDRFPKDIAYTGVDRREGPCVDVVCDAVDYDGEERFELVVSAEMLEHAENPVGVIRAAWRSLAPGGYLILTAAGPERTPHNNNGDHFVPEGEHYGNIDPEELRGWLVRQGFEILNVTHAPEAGDVYATAKKPA